MQYTHLGSSNVQVSRFCLGTMMFGGKTDQAESIRITRAAIDAGVNFIDTADVYSETRCESIVGEALQGVRDRVVLATKAGMKTGPGVNDQGVSRFHYVRAVEASLKRLGTDRIDVYYAHWPTMKMNLDEMMRAMDDLIRAGKIVYPACSNFPSWLVMRTQWVADMKGYAPLVCGQYPYNLIERGLEVELLPMAEAMKFGITVYRPLAIGVLTGRYIDAKPADTRGEKDARVDKWMTKYGQMVRDLAALAAEQGTTPVALANAWAASHPGVSSVIVGISRVAQLEENLKGFEATLTPEQREKITALFPTEMHEEAGGGFPGWRRRGDIL
ncbi:MAG: aldo/keto reductase [Burkholderiales bacterium]|nr:aldo/keto reductase [Phycisphaerae bacterium]